MPSTSGSKFMNLFNLKEVPIFLTLLFTLLGWTFMKMSDKVTESPTIEYKLIRNSPDKKDTNTFYFRLINLTNNHQFKNLSFKISSPPGSGKFVRGILHEVAPAPIYNLMPYIEPFYGSEVIFTIKRFNPKTQYNLVIYYTGEIRHPIFELSYTGITDETVTEPVMLKEASLFTFLIKNDVALYVVLFVILLILIAIYLYIISNQKT